MKKTNLTIFVFMLTILSGLAQQKEVTANTLLWKISGNGLEKPSYLYGTIHMICKEDAGLSEQMLTILRDVSEVYFEVDLDNMMEMLGAMNKMKMKGDTTLSDLLSVEEYERVKAYFEGKKSVLPFSMLEKYKPILAASVLEQDKFPCDATAMMEQVIMQEAKQHGKKIKGLETMGYQASILDDIPYKLQAEQLVAYIDNAVKGEQESATFDAMLDAYKEQNLQKLENVMMQSEVGMEAYSEVLLYRRNRNWVQKLKNILPGNSLLIAVGAGHLPGKEGVIDLLKKQGYTVTPLDNKKTTAIKTI